MATTESLLSIELAIIGILVSTILSITALIYSLKQHNENTALQSFETITGFIDNDISLINRRIIYTAKNTWESLINDFNTCVPPPEISDLIKMKHNILNHSSNNTKLNNAQVMDMTEEINHAAFEIAVSYDRVCFLISQNKKLKQKIIKFHGATILKNFIIIQGLMKKWKEERGRSDHPYFHDISHDIWNHYHDVRKSAIGNLIISQDDIFVGIETNTLNKKIISKKYYVNCIEEWGQKIFERSFSSDRLDSDISFAINKKELKNTKNEMSENSTAISGF